MARCGTALVLLIVQALVLHGSCLALKFPVRLLNRPLAPSQYDDFDAAILPMANARTADKRSPLDDMMMKKSLFDQMSASNFGFGPRRFFFRRADKLVVG
ncbi:hypothetical protein AAVH_15478 [Aphelenchoides avenae]|nr:hypothetical protein AAVH_15478 [Aphelenchus avenae]